MLTTNGTLRCSATCAIAAAAPESNGPTSTCAPSLISFSARERATSTLVSVSAFISSMSTPYMSRISAGEMSAPSWHDWPMNACTPERGSSTPTFSFFGWARTNAGAASVPLPTTADAAASRLKSRRVTLLMVSSSYRVKRRPVRGAAAGSFSGSSVRLSRLTRLVAQHALQDFPCGTLRQLGHDVDSRRHLVGGDVGAAVRDDLVCGQRLAGLGHHGGDHLFALFGMGQPVDRHLLDLRQLV